MNNDFNQDKFIKDFQMIHHQARCATLSYIMQEYPPENYSYDYLKNKYPEYSGISSVSENGIVALFIDGRGADAVQFTFEQILSESVEEEYHKYYLYMYLIHNQYLILV